MTPKARKPLRRVSDKQRAIQEGLRALRAAVEARDGRCRCQTLGLVPEVRCWGPTDLDHLRSRARGGDLVSLGNVIALCRGHHIWKDEHPREAEAIGLWPHSWDAREGLPPEG